MNIIKRDGRSIPFDKAKIEIAIKKAFRAVDRTVSKEAKDIASSVTEEINTELLQQFLKNSKEPTVEEIQDLVEQKLMATHRKDVAKAYILYRDERTRNRNKNSELMKAVGEKITADNVENQNANVDERSFGGRNGEARAVVTREYARTNLISDMSRKHHDNNEIYIHDFDNYSVGMHNCLTMPLDRLLQNGFITRQTDVRPAGSVRAAMQQTAVLFQLQSLCQFGGVAASHLDYTMVPFVRKSFAKHFKNGMRYIEGHSGYEIGDKNLSIVDPYYKGYEKAYAYAIDQLVEETKQAAEALYHNLNTLQSRSGDQLPFTSVNFGTCTLPEGRLVSKHLLETSIAGLGKLHSTSIFPCQIFKLKKGLNRHPGDPNYDLFRLALRSTAQRLYPNYANVDWSGNAGYDPDDPATEFATMGALDGKEHLYVRFDHSDTIYDMSIRDLFLWAKGQRAVSRPAQIAFSKAALSLPGKSKLVQDHSQVTADRKPGVYAITYIPLDVTYIGASACMGQRWNEHRVAIRTTGGPDCGMKFGDPELANYRFEVLEYTENYAEREKAYIDTMPNINIRGNNAKYFKVLTRKHPPVYDRPDFVQDRTVSQELIDLSDKDVMVLDRDGKWVKVRHIFMNDKRNTPLMMHIRYQELDHNYTLSCTEDHPLWTGNEFTQAADIKPGDHIYRADGLELTVIETSWHWEPVESYDIGTESGTFIGSDIQMHNCRTANGFDINGFGQRKDGRGNICPVTIILPTIAMYVKQELEADGLDLAQAPDDVIITAFLKKLEGYITDAKDMLLERLNHIASQPAASAPFMYINNTMEGFDGSDIISALKHGTLAIGQLGLAETLQILIGCDHTEKRGMEAAKAIEQLFKDKCAAFKQEHRLNFGVYYTPAENLCYTAMKKFRQSFGILPNISDRDFFTNSTHVPVWTPIDPFRKIDIESELTGYSSAGCITYVELDATAKNNIDALETLVNYAMDKDIPYFAINVPNDKCMDCGYEDEIPNKCPVCGSGYINRLRRVTGYLTTDYHHFNKGKQQEVEMRYQHTRLSKLFHPEGAKPPGFDC